MRTELLVNAVGFIDSSIVDESETHRPARKKHIIIGVAAAACLCLAVVFVFGLNRRDAIWVEAALNIHFVGIPEHGYIDYRERAEPGKVLITDELQAMMEEYKNERPLFGAWQDSNEFLVRIVDVNGASASEIYSAFLQPLGLHDHDTESFFTGQLVTLTSEEIKSIKGSPEFALIISPPALVIDQEYLNTVGRDTLDVYVLIDTGKGTPVWYEDEKGVHTFDEETWETVEGPRRTKIFNEYISDYGIDRDKIKDFRDSTVTFRAELSTELISRLLADERTKFIYVIVDY